VATPDYYAILGVSPRATQEEITAVFNRQVQRFPKEARDPTCNVAFRQLVVAYRVLSNQESRETFDQTRTTHVISGSQALKVQLFVSQTTLPAVEEVQLFYLLLDISANPALSRKKPPVNLGLVVDRSTSMKGARINQVKAAASLIAGQLEPQDSFSLVVFSDRAEVIVPAGRVENKSRIKSKISQISTGGATEMLRGLQLGLVELRKAKGFSEISHLILLTDGHTYGDEKECIQLAEQAAANGVGISALGIGHKWNDSFLDELVASSGSSSAYLESPQKVVEYLQERIKTLNHAFAQDAQLRLDLPAGIRARSVNKLSPFPQPVVYSNRAMPLGTLEHNVPLSVLVELVAQPHPPDTLAYLLVDISANIVPTGQRAQHFVSQLELDFALNPPQKPPLPAIVRAVNKLNLYKMNEKAWEEVEQGKIEQATRRMERLGTHLLNAGQTRLARTAFEEATNIARTGHLSAVGRKKLKYGTRALIGQ